MRTRWQPPAPSRSAREAPATWWRRWTPRAVSERSGCAGAPVGRPRPQPVAPRVDPGSGSRAHEEPLDAGVDGLDVVKEVLQVELEVGQEVDLVHEDELARAEHERVLERLVLALGDRRHHDAVMLADTEGSR